MAQVARRAGRDATSIANAIGTAGADPDGFARLGVAELPRLVPSELTTLSVCDLITGRRRVVGNPDRALSPEDITAFDRHFFEHPLVRFHSTHHGGGAHRISDSVPSREFRDSALYNDYYRHIGIDHAIAVPLYVDGRTLVSFVLNRRGRDFSTREVALLDRLRGWLAGMYCNAVTLQRMGGALAQLREVAEADGWAVVHLDGRRHIRELSPRAAILLAGACAWARPRAGVPLPAPIDAWLLRVTCDNAPWLSLAPLTLPTSGGGITLRAVPEGGNGVAWTLLVRGEPAAAQGNGVEVALTPREGEILRWVAAGKTDRQIATIVGASYRTVQKHLEHIYVKLGVENRTAAAMRGMRK